MAEIDGATILARCLKSQGIQFCFGIVGFPVAPIAAAMQKEGLTFIGMRHEQSAAYAAGAIGYLTGKPGAALTVSGPGMTNAISGLGNAQANCWPMVLISGAHAVDQTGMGAFQAAPQLEVARPFVKYAMRPESTDRIPYYVEQAVRTSTYGRPGPAYLEMTDDIIVSQMDEAALQMPPVVRGAPRALASEESVDAAIGALKTAENPLVIIGKGAAYARAEEEVRQFIETTNLPFLATPMGSGILPDDHPLSAGAARSLALQNADLIFLIGARLNWILHYGRPPRFKADVRVIQLDIAAEEIGTNVPAEVGLVGDARQVIRQINDHLAADPWQYPTETTWTTALQQKIEENRAKTEPLLADDELPMGYYRAFREIRDLIPEDAMVVAEGATTMDVSRQVLLNRAPRRRLDAGTWGTMGVGPAQAIAAAVVNPGKSVVAIEGDSAFGFGAMEVEVACRLNLPITFVVFNNNGVGGGPTELLPMDRIPPGALYPGAHYEKVIEAFGGLGFHAETPDELSSAMQRAISSGRPSILNVTIRNTAGRRPQQFAWHTGSAANPEGYGGTTSLTPVR